MVVAGRGNHHQGALDGVGWLCCVDLGAAAAVDPPPTTGADPPELLDIHMDQLTRAVALVAACLAQLLAGGPVQITQPVQTQPDQHPVHPGRADRQRPRAQFGGDADRAQLALTAQPLDAALHVQRYPGRAVRGSAGVVTEPGLALGAPGGVPLRQALAGNTSAELLQRDEGAARVVAGRGNHPHGALDGRLIAGSHINGCRLASRSRLVLHDVPPSWGRRSSRGGTTARPPSRNCTARTVSRRD